MLDIDKKADSPEQTSEPATVRLVIPAATISKVVAAGLLCLILYELMPFLMLLFLSLLLAITFDPLVTRIAKRFGRTFGVFSIAAGVGAVFILLFVLVLPPLIEQATAIYHQLPSFVESISQKYPQLGYLLQKLPQKISTIDPTAASPILARLAAVGGLAIGGLSGLALIYVFMVYLLIDGRRAYAWFLAFFGPSRRSKIQKTSEGVAPVISAYVIGQIITSVLCGLFTYASLTVIGVPAAIVLAVLAAVFDILPIIGFFLFAIPSALFALTVSSTAMLSVLGLFLAYHLLESYLIAPMIYGNRLRVSGIVVLLALIIGASLGGILGAIAILPVVASYPVIEEIWLSKLLGRRTIDQHKLITEESDAAVDALSAAQT